MDETRSHHPVSVAGYVGQSFNSMPPASSLNRDEIEAVHFLADSLMRIGPQERASQAPLANGHMATGPSSPSLANNQLWSDDFIRKLGNSLAYTVNRHSTGMDSQHLLAHYAIQAKMARNLLPAYVLPQLDQDENPTGNGIVFLVGERGRLIPYGPTAPFCPTPQPAPQQVSASSQRQPQQKTQQQRAKVVQNTEVQHCTVPLSTTTSHFVTDYNNGCQQQQYQLCQQYDGNLHTVGVNNINFDAASQQYHQHQRQWAAVEEDTNAGAPCSSASTTRLGSAFSDGASQMHAPNAVIQQPQAAATAAPTTTSSRKKKAPNNSSSPQQSQNSRRPRTTFEPWQIEKLEMIFAQDNYPTKPAIHDMSSVVGLADNTIRVWFQNRRAKIKREKSDGDTTTLSGLDQIGCDTSDGMQLDKPS